MLKFLNLMNLKFPKLIRIMFNPFLMALDTSKSNVQNNIPVKILNQFSELLAESVTHVIIASLTQGKWPDLYKLEIVTPVPKEFPPEKY